MSTSLIKGARSFLECAFFCAYYFPCRVQHYRRKYYGEQHCAQQASQTKGLYA